MTKKELFEKIRKMGIPVQLTCVLVGNILAESGGKPNNVQNSYEKKLGMNDEEYTAAVDSGQYSEYQWEHDSVGYGLCQWTYWTRKKALKAYCDTYHKSIGDGDTQIAFMLDELKPLKNKLLACKTMFDAMLIMVREYEKPADQSRDAIMRRVELANQVYAECVAESDFSTTKTTVVTIKLRDGKIVDTQVREE